MSSQRARATEVREVFAMTLATQLQKWSRWGGRSVLFLGFTAAVILLVLWLAGKFAPKVSLEPRVADSTVTAIRGRVESVRNVPLPRYESAVGTIRAVHETTIGSKLLARVVEVNLKAGQQVKVDEPLVRLDDTDLQAKLKQAQAAVTAAEAIQAQAVVEKRRAAQLRESKAISNQEYERSARALETAEADLLRAREVVKEVQATLDWATVRAPIDGTVIDKKVDVGDTVTPGQPLVTLFDPTRMQLVASVRESLALRLKAGDPIDVRIDGLAKDCTGTISEIVPEAQAASRTFQVKVTGPCPTGIYTGMFGRILIPLGQQEVPVIPAAAVRQVGQVELVDVAFNGGARRRAVRTGRRFDADFNVIGDVSESDRLAYVEVLSGLNPQERIVVPDNQLAPQETSHE